MDGLLLINKPETWTSFDVVAKTRATLKAAGIQKPKVGHSGTLDPLADGLLLILVGAATKAADHYTKLDKTYQAEMELGQESSTGDREGAKSAISTRQPTKMELQEVIRSFEGSIEQVPPKYSAIKVNGTRAYVLARQGKEVTLAPRTVHLHHLELTDYHYPHASLRCEVSSGTYIRTLIEDIGKKLGTGAYTTKLTRVKVGEFSLAAAVDIKNLTANEIYEHLQKLS